MTHGVRVYCDKNEVDGENRVLSDTLADAKVRIFPSF